MEPCKSYGAAQRRSRLARAVCALRQKPSRSACRSAVPAGGRVHSASSVVAHASSVTVVLSGRGMNAGSVTARANFAFHGRTSWEGCRDTRIVVALS